MSKRRYSKAIDWLPVIEEWKQTGLSKKDFCEEKQINYKLFYRWYSKLITSEPREVKYTKKTPLISRDFIPIEIAPSPQITASLTTCILQIGSQLQLHVPMSVVNHDFLHALLEATGVKPC